MDPLDECRLTTKVEDRERRTPEEGLDPTRDGWLDDRNGSERVEAPETDRRVALTSRPEGISVRREYDRSGVKQEEKDSLPLLINHPLNSSSITSRQPTEPEWPCSLATGWKLSRSQTRMTDDGEPAKMYLLDEAVITQREGAATSV